MTWSARELESHWNYRSALQLQLLAEHRIWLQRALQLDNKQITFWSAIQWLTESWLEMRTYFLKVVRVCCARARTRQDHIFVSISVYCICSLICQPRSLNVQYTVIFIWVWIKIIALYSPAVLKEGEAGTQASWGGQNTEYSKERIGLWAGFF